MAYAYRHEAAVLVGIHASLEISKPAGICYGLVVAIEAATGILAASGRVYKPQVVAIVLHHGIGHLVEASGRLGTVAVQAYRIVVG